MSSAWFFPAALGWLSGAYVSELRARAARSRREQELETGRAVAEEQARVGRELHDVIAHTLSVIVIQAGAADDVFGTRPEAARQALRSIGSAGRQALAELRRVLPAVRPQPAEAERRVGAAAGAVWPRRAASPGPGHRPERDRPGRRRPGGLARRAGPGRLPDRAGGPDEHAQARPGAGSRGDLSATARPGLSWRSLDDGPARGAGRRRGPAPGRGLIGIRERAALHGGTCDAGPRPGGGFGVRASFPLPGDRPS